MTEPTDEELDTVLCNQWPAFSMQATLVRVWVRAAMRDALAKWGTPQPVVREPDFWTVCAQYEDGDEAGWVPLPCYSNETKLGVMDLVLKAARMEGHKGTASERLQELGWEIRPVYLAPRSSLQQPVPASAAEFALRALVAAGHVTQERVDQAMALPGAPAQPVVPAGYALVPVEPTPEMLSVMWVNKNSSLSEAYNSLSEAYSAMLAASPQPVVVREPLTDEQPASKEQTMIEPTDATLQQRCAEILEWQRTGVLTGNALRDYAAQHWPEHHDALQMSERDTSARAIELIAKWGAPPAVAGEPVAWRYVPSKVWGEFAYTEDPKRAQHARDNGIDVQPVFTTPQPTQAQAGAVPLTDEQRNAIYDKHCFLGDNGWEIDWWKVIDEVEAAHSIGIKNGDSHGLKT